MVPPGGGRDAGGRKLGERFARGTTLEDGSQQEGPAQPGTVGSGVQDVPVPDGRLSRGLSWTLLR